MRRIQYGKIRYPGFPKWGITNNEVRLIIKAFGYFITWEK